MPQNVTCTRLTAFALLGCGLLFTGCAPGGVFGTQNNRQVGDNSNEKISESRTGTSSTTSSTKATPAKANTAKTNKSKPSVDQDAGSYSQQLAKGRTLENGGRWDEARTIYEKLAVDFPERYEAFHRLGVVADHRRHYADAQGYYLKAIALHPDDAEILNDLGYCYFLQGHLKNAETSLVKATKLAPDNPRYRNNLGLVHGHEGQMELALVDFRKSGSEAEAQYNLAFILAANNDTEGATRRFQQALAADPNFEPARKALRSFERADSDSAMLADYEETNAEGVRLVPYVEAEAANGAASSSKVQRASGSGNSAGTNTRALQSQARSMMQDRLSTQE